MSTTKQPTTASVLQLETIIRKLEAWQCRYDRFDSHGSARAAKDKLMHLLRELDAAKST